MSYNNYNEHMEKPIFGGLIKLLGTKFCQENAILVKGDFWNLRDIISYTRSNCDQRISVMTDSF